MAEIREAFSASRLRRPKISDTRTILGTEISRDIEKDRQTRTESRAILSDRISSEHRESVAIVEPTRTSGIERTATDSGSNTSPIGGVESDRKRANITKFQNRKIEDTLNKILTPQKRNFIERTIAALSNPMSIEQIAEQNTRRRQKEIDKILSTRPNISENDLSRDFQKSKLCYELFDGIKARKKDIELYEKTAQLAQSKVSGLDKFLSNFIKIESVLKAEQAQAKFTELSNNFDKLNFNDNGKIANSGEMAKYLAEENRKTLWKWENKPEIKTALKAEELLSGAKSTAGAGNEQMKILLAENKIKEALELQQRIEQAQKEIALKNQQKIANQSNPSAAVAAPSGPKMR